MQAFKSRSFALPIVAAFSLASGAVLAQAQAPAAAAAADKVKVDKMVKPAALSDRTKSANDTANRPVTRDWAQVDTNRDNLISPEEMEAYLKAMPGPLAAKM